MPRGTRNLQINRQQKHILLLALFLLKHAQGKVRPLKRQVISFIDIKNLILIREEDRRTVATGEEAWENSIAWRRADLVAEGCLTMPARGEWQITAAGERRVIDWCAIMHYFTTLKPDWQKHLSALETIFEEKVVITEQTILAAVAAFDIAKKLFADDLPEVPADVRGRIRL